MSMDEEYARMVIEAEARSGESKGGGAPSMSAWTEEAAMMAVVVDKISALIATTVNANGGNAGQVVPYPRPKTALDKVRAERRQKQHERLVSLLLPGKAEG
jgi:hypothetical protein